MTTNIEQDAREAAAWISTALSSSGYIADFSGASLWEIDRFFDEHSKDGEARPGGLLAESLGSGIFAVGAYIGEVVLREVGGAWEGVDADPEAELSLALRLRDGSQVWPVQRAMKRLKLGADEGIAAYGAALGVSVGPKPPSKRKWRFW